MRQVPVIGVASVFTPAQNRGKGYAGLMMRLLADKVREMTGNKGFSVLYSDVGPHFTPRMEVGRRVTPTNWSFLAANH